MQNTITFVGMDVHKKDTKVEMVLPDGEEVSFSSATDARRLLKGIRRRAQGEIVCCYEAGPCGYMLKRAFEKQGIKCQVVAPSLIPRKPGERIKTDRRDARKLARLLRSGDLTEVHAPSRQEEAARDLCRAREAAREDLKRARHRLQKYLLRRAVIWPKNSWTKAHRLWLRGRRFEDDLEQQVFNYYLSAVEWQEDLHKGLEEKLEALSGQEPYRAPVGVLRCFRGVDTVTAMSIVTELHGFIRFETPRALMAYLGVIPGEISSGQRRCQTGITKTGNGHVRRLLIEAAWHYRHRPHTGCRLRKRREGQAEQVVALADRAQRRLHRRYWAMTSKGKPPNKAVVAVARELIGFLWAALYPMAVMQEAA